MAQLFKKNIVKEKLNTFEIPNLEEKIEVLKKWEKLHREGTLISKKEEELEWPFWSDFFGKILDYHSFWENEIYNRKFQPKVPEWWQKADIWLWFFWENIDIMKVVVELKDAKTSLDKPQQRAWNLTPVQQAFKYKPYFKDCDFIIVSNFNETRLYIDSYYDYEAWTLSDLINPFDNYFNFRRFYYLLNKQNLIIKKWESNTKSLLSYIRIQEKEITKQFYKEYTFLRKELFKDIVTNNPWFKKTELDFLLNKTQKIIDRIIFIHFCEDLWLLPQDKLKEVIEYGEKSLATTWETLSNFFRAVDKGSEKLEIPDWYNWGLFHEDTELNNLKVWDKICKKFIDMWEYNFADDLSVNILGHIFEQSISDIEELKDKINKQEDATLSKRKKDWVFYTPEYIVDYIVKNSVGKKIDEWEDELKQKHNLKENITDKNYNKRAILVYEELQNKVHNIKVLDPACWSGAFLVKVFDFLLDKNKEISKKLEDLWVNQGLFSSESYFRTILKNNIYWVDLNEESVEITKLSLWLKTAQKGKKLANLDSNIKCGNSLIDDKEIAWEKAFFWETEFKEIFDNGWFDVVVGNPPYVSTKQINKIDRDFFWNTYWDILIWEMDLYQIFIYISLNKLLNKSWNLGFITPNSYYTNKSFSKFRDYIFKNTSIYQIIDFPYRFFPFDEVNTETSIITLKNSYNYNNFINLGKIDKEKINYSSNLDLSTYFNNSFKQNDFFSIYKEKIVIDANSILEKLINIKDVFWGHLDLHKWWMSIPNSTEISWEKYDKWTFSYEEINNSEILKNNTIKYLEWRDIHRYYIDNTSKYVNISNIDEKTKKWHISEKIALQRIVWQNKSKIFATYVWSEYIIFPNANLVNIKDNKNNIYYFLWILNSKLINYFYWKYYWESNTNITKDAFELIPFAWFKNEEEIINNVISIIDKNKKLQKKVNKFIKRLKSSFEIEKLSKKLEAFYDLEFSDFVKELKKKKVELSLKDQDEWEEYFDSYKKEILELKSEIDNCDKEIDEMVFELYGLSKEERGVVLNS